jgi:hypothetical protein
MPLTFRPWEAVGATVIAIVIATATVVVAAVAVGIHLPLVATHLPVLLCVMKKLCHGHHTRILKKRRRALKKNRLRLLPRLMRW